MPMTYQWIIFSPKHRYTGFAEVKTNTACRRNMVSHIATADCTDNPISALLPGEEEKSIIPLKYIHIGAIKILQIFLLNDFL